MKEKSDVMELFKDLFSEEEYELIALLNQEKGSEEILDILMEEENNND